MRSHAFALKSPCNHLGCEWVTGDFFFKNETKTRNGKTLKKNRDFGRH